MWPGGEADFNAAERWIDDWQARVAERAARTQTLAGRLPEMTGAGSAANGWVSVTVNSSGALVDVRLDEQVRKHSAQWIAQQVLTASRAATADLVRQARTIVAETVGRDSPEGAAVVQAFTARLGEDS